MIRLLSIAILSALVCTHGAASAEQYGSDPSTVRLCHTNAKGVLRIGAIHFIRGDAQKVDHIVDDFGFPALVLVFTDKGRQKLIAAQHKKIGKPLTICLGKKLLSNPILNEMVTGNSIHISGFDASESANLARLLRAYFNVSASK